VQDPAAQTTPFGQANSSSLASDDEARTQFPGGWTSDLPYLRRVPQPGLEEEQAQPQGEPQTA